MEEILSNIRATICDLQPHHVHTFYEAVGYMIQAQVVSGRNKRVVCLRMGKDKVMGRGYNSYIIIRVLFGIFVGEVHEIFKPHLLLS